MLSLTDIVNPAMNADQDEESFESDDNSVVDLLLQHKRCANHTLNLVAAVDSLKFEIMPDTKERMTVQ